MDFTKFLGDPFPGVADKWVSDGTMKEMIIVFPNSSNRYGGSQYANSEVSGRWADFIVRDVVSYIDKKFRTLPKPESRGLAGHSMGGRGVLYLALRFPGIFGAVYASSAGAMAFDRTGYGSTEAWEKLLAARDAAEVTDDVEVRRVLTYSVAFSPNRENPPFFADFPKAMKDEVLITRPDIASRWADFDPVQMVEKDASSLQQLRALYFDCGTADRLIAGNRLLAAALKRKGVVHTYEEHDGDHGNRFVERFSTKILPMFSAHLVFD